MRFFLLFSLLLSYSLLALPPALTSPYFLQKQEQLEQKSRKDVETLRFPKFYWQMALLLNKKPNSVKAHMAALCKGIISSCLQKESPPIKDLVPLIVFWSTLEDNACDDTCFLRAIDALWIKKRNLSRARELTLFLNHFSKKSHRALCAILQRTFSYFLTNDDVEALVFIHPLLITFEVEPPITNQIQLIKNQIADAEYRLARGEKDEARLRLQWVLLLQKNESKALTLLHSIEKS